VGSLLFSTTFYYSPLLSWTTSIVHVTPESAPVVLACRILRILADADFPSPPPPSPPTSPFSLSRSLLSGQAPQEGERDKCIEMWPLKNFEIE